MNDIKLEVGKSYITEGGDKVSIDLFDKAAYFFPYRSTTNVKGREVFLHYTENGEVFVDICIGIYHYFDITGVYED